jgi:hypothetical protein
MRRLSVAMYYKLRERGLAPKVYRIGRKVCVSADADEEWLHAREAESASA